MIERLKRLLRRVDPRGSVPAPEAASTAGAPPPLRVLMVCTGNICRSPTAEAVLRTKLQRAAMHRSISVDSAGTHGFHASDPPDPRARSAAALRGYELGSIRARSVVDEDFVRFDYILAMDQSNLNWLNRHATAERTARIELLMDYARQPLPSRDVPDPYYGAPSGFDHVLDLVEDACTGLVEHLARGPGVAGVSSP